MNKIFTLQVKDFIKGLVVAVLSAVVIALYSMVRAPGFTWAAIDLNEISVVAVGALLGYLSKQFVSSDNGRAEEAVAGIKLPESRG